MPKLSGQSLVCDSSSLISLTDSCFVHVFYFLRRKCKGRFLIPPSVEFECVEHPMKMKMHALHAVRLKRAILDGAITLSPLSSREKSSEIKWIANNMFYVSGTPLHLLHEGEADMIALAIETGVQNLLIDERTTRMLAEDPESLRKHLELEFSRPITIDEENLSAFSRLTRGMRFFRSSELLLLAYETGYFQEYKDLKQDAIEAALYRLKYAGCAVGMGEIEDYVKESIRA